MIIDFDVPIKDFSGRVLKDVNSDGEVVDSSLKVSVINSLLLPLEREQPIDKLPKYDLAKRIYSEGKVDLDEKQIAIITRCLSENQPALICGTFSEIVSKRE